MRLNFQYLNNYLCIAFYKLIEENIEVTMSSNFATLFQHHIKYSKELIHYNI